MIAPDIVTISAGWFLMGSMQGQENEQPCHRVWLDSFGIGRFPITNREYKKFIEATGRQPPPFCLDPIFSEPEQPIVAVSWDDAAAYCAWLSEQRNALFRLPSEAEWERAARGGLEGALYPWGDEPPPPTFVGCNLETGGPAKVGLNAPNGFGLYDMSENVHEWCADWYDYNSILIRRTTTRAVPTSGSGAFRVAARGVIESNTAAVRRAAHFPSLSNMPTMDFG